MYIQTGVLSSVKMSGYSTADIA